MGMIKATLDNITWDALREGEIIIDGTTYEVWGSEQLKEALNESLDEGSEPFKIGTLTYYRSQILSGCDPIAYEMAMSEHADSLIDYDILVYGYTLTDAVTSANDFAETTNAAYTVTQP